MIELRTVRLCQETLLHPFRDFKTEGRKDTSKEESTSGSDGVSQLVASTFKIFHFPWKTPILIGLGTLFGECLHSSCFLIHSVYKTAFSGQNKISVCICPGGGRSIGRAINTQGTRHQ